MRVLVTGHTGLLGARFVELAARDYAGRIELHGVSLEQLDIADAAAFEAFARPLAPEVVIHTAACANVDHCEHNRAFAEAANIGTARNVAALCRELGAKGVYISSDYIFDGVDVPAGGYVEDSPTNPLNYYGRTKLEGEHLFRELDDHLIVRTAWLFGGGTTATSYVLDVLDHVGRGSAYKAISDQRGSPTYSVDLAATILALLVHDDREAGRGTLHIANRGSVTWFELARKTAELCGGVDRAGLIEPVAMDASHYQSDRPRDSTLNTDALAAVLGRPLPTWDDALARCLRDM